MNKLMNSCERKLSRLPAIAAVVFSLACTQLLAQSEAAQAQLAQSRQLLEQLEDTYGRLDPRLLESLEQLGNRLSELGEYDDAIEVLDQAIQITRLSEGLFTRSQLPLQFSKIDNLVDARDWRRANRLMEYLVSLLNRRENIVDEEFIQALLRLADLHLRGVAEDGTVRQSTHIKDAARLTERALNLAVSAWGPNDLRLPAIIYKRVVQLHLQARAVEVGGSISIGLRSFSSPGMARSRGDVLLEYYFYGLSRLGQIRNIYLNQETPMPEAVAFADVYIGDWQVLFSNQEGAERSYLSAYNGFRSANIEQQAINRFFHSPILLPAISLYNNWEEANAASNIDVGKEVNTLDIANLSVTPWSVNFSHVSSPIEFDTSTPGPAGFREMAEYSLILAGLEKVYRWYQGRYITTISTAQQLRPVRARSLDPETQFELEARIKSIRFRPKLVDGVAQAVSAKLFYDTFQ
ncbi:MAG: tetratricopeptide repeat protein [Proteobacteria bacterium]|nr:tetratricopeptide repeat protein [Pseudomonadota bacterium]